LVITNRSGKGISRTGRAAIADFDSFILEKKIADILQIFNGGAMWLSIALERAQNVEDFDLEISILLFRMFVSILTFQ
jgi:hypothetical protein